MTENKTLEILKQAILLEKRGRAFYLTAANQAKNEAVKSFFQTMADEEKHHMEILAEHLKSFSTSNTFSPGDYDSMSSKAPEFVLTDDVKAKISAAGFEAAAISAAMLMEDRAIKLYAARAEAAEDTNEKALYRYLTSWERDHLTFLSDLDKELTENIWHDNNFWPF
ncbi:MAG: ferritin family protein [Desulfobacteraceae bacterium]|nr:ferritin family protein [Desulfobacteraceae bacterium]